MKRNPFCKITFILIIFWIIISIIKKIVNHDGLKRYNFIERNTLGYWIWISLGLCLSKHFFKRYLYAPLFILGILIVHEFICYQMHINILKDEGEVTSNFYRWFNIYGTSIKTLDFNNQSTDISEALFDNKWNINNSEALKIKYDTYYDYLKLEPGMKLLDIGCGNCHWLTYCKKRGINCTGITISSSQQDFCHKNNINVILGDIQKNVLLTIDEKFDAISAIGPVEHFSSISQSSSERNNILNKYYDQVKKRIDLTSHSRRYLNSIMTTNDRYSQHKIFKWYVRVYFIASAFGYGYYPSEEEIEKIYNSGHSKLIIKRDYTEDYRWITARNPSSWAYINYHFDTPYRIFNFFKDVLIDPSWWQRAIYAYLNCWLWQFGGTIQKPIPTIKDTPIRSYIYVTEINGY